MNIYEYHPTAAQIQLCNTLLEFAERYEEKDPVAYQGDVLLGNMRTAYYAGDVAVLYDGRAQAAIEHIKRILEA